MVKKSAIVLVTGFLGCGKTTLIKEFLQSGSPERSVAVIQNEFSQTSIDGDILRGVDRNFSLKELNTGSIFCVCLFAKFKDAVVEIVEQYAPDIIVVEASGIADPIAVAELVEDKRVAEVAYLSRILTVVDAPRFEVALSKIVGVRHQVQVADAVLINKCDLVDDEQLSRVSNIIRDINPIAHEIRGEYGKFEIETLINEEPTKIEKLGELTRCGDGNYISKSFRSAQMVQRAKLDVFLDSLTDDTRRLKGYVTTTEGESLMIHYVPGQCVVTRCESNLAGRCELISIGYAVPQFNMLK